MTFGELHGTNGVVNDLVDALNKRISLRIYNGGWQQHRSSEEAQRIQRRIQRRIQIRYQ